MAYTYTEREKQQRKQKYERNKLAVLSSAKVRYHKDPEKYKLMVRGRHLKNNYFPLLTPQQALDKYAEMHEAQKGLCLICMKPEIKIDPQNKKPCLLAVDHDPKTNHVRGLLCFMCNTSLGRLERNFSRIIDYLRNSKLNYVRGLKNG
jgi:hypothetical protein